MTEEEWANGSDSLAMVRFMFETASARKSRLFAVAAVRFAALEQPANSVLDRAIDVAERFADDLASKADLDACKNEVAAILDGWKGPHGHAYSIVYMIGVYLLSKEHLMAARGHYFLSPLETPVGMPVASQLLRDIFGNPFRPVAFDPAWRAVTVTSLAEAIYAERAFERLPILADALEDAGCTSAEVLEHCRGPGPHVRGCWVVDLLLGKE